MKLKTLLLLLLLPMACWSGEPVTIKIVEFEGLHGVSNPILVDGYDGIKIDDGDVIPPLPIKIDTLSVDTDTVGWRLDTVKVQSCADFPNEAHWMTLMGCPPSNPDCNHCTVHWKTICKAVAILDITYTTDTTYRLTSEQVRLQELISQVDKKHDIVLTYLNNKWCISTRDKCFPNCGICNQSPYYPAGVLLDSATHTKQQQIKASCPHLIIGRCGGCK